MYGVRDVVEEPLFGKYDLRSKLKVGGFGSVYRAKAVSASDTNLYAIKVMPKKHVKYAEIEHKLYQTIKKAEFTMGFVKVPVSGCSTTNTATSETTYV